MRYHPLQVGGRRYGRIRSLRATINAPRTAKPGVQVEGSTATRPRVALSDTQLARVRRAVLPDEDVDVVFVILRRVAGVAG